MRRFPRPEAPFLPFGDPKPPSVNSGQAETTDPAVRAMKHAGFEIVRPKEPEAPTWNKGAFESAFGEFDRDYETTDDRGGVFRVDSLLGRHRADLLRAAKGHPLYEELKTALSGNSTGPVFEICQKMLSEEASPSAKTAS